MKTLLLILFYYLIAYSQIINFPSKENTYTLSNITALTPADGYSAPKWSPDGKKILFTKMNYTGLFVIDLRNKNEIVKLNMLRGAGFNAQWSKDGNNIYYRHKTPDKYKDINPIQK